MIGNEDIKMELQMKEEYPEDEQVLGMNDVERLEQFHRWLGDRLLAIEANIKTLADRITKMEKQNVIQ